MSAPLPQNTLRIRGRLITTPTDLTAAESYGGTYLGDFDEISWELVPLGADLTAQEFGGVPYEGIENGLVMSFGARLRTWDADMIAALFPSAMVTTTAGSPTVRFSASSHLGLKKSARAVKILCAPEHPERETALLAYAAVPQLEATARASHSLGADWGLPLLFTCYPTTAGDIADYGLIRNLELSP